MSDKHPNGYTKEMIRELLGTSCPEWDPTHETGNEIRKRKGREMRAGLRPYPEYNQKREGPNFDENGKYIYPPGSGFNYAQWLKDHPDSTEAVSSTKVS